MRMSFEGSTARLGAEYVPAGSTSSLVAWIGGEPQRLLGAGPQE